MNKVDKAIKLVIYSSKETTIVDGGVSFGIVKVKAYGGEVDKIILPVEDEQTVNYMDLFCFRYAIAALTGNDGCTVELHSKNDWIRKMFDHKNGEWVNKATGLKDVVEHLRTLIEESGFTVVTRKLHTQEVNSMKKESLKVVDKLNKKFLADKEAASKYSPDFHGKLEKSESEPEVEIDTNKFTSIDDEDELDEREEETGEFI